MKRRAIENDETEAEIQVSLVDRGPEVIKGTVLLPPIGMKLTRNEVPP